VKSSTVILAIDPGSEESAYVAYDTATRLPREWAKVPNDQVLTTIDVLRYDDLAIEMVASYGMAVGATVFETCVWIGRFMERFHEDYGLNSRRVYRKDVKLHLCGTTKAKDTNIRQAIIDRYGPGKEKAVGLKASPGPLYGMKADCWSALAVAITAAETSTTGDA
jgi:hypothetical protein